MIRYLLNFVNRYLCLVPEINVFMFGRNKAVYDKLMERHPFIFFKFDDGGDVVVNKYVPATFWPAFQTHAPVILEPMAGMSGVGLYDHIQTNESIVSYIDSIAET